MFVVISISVESTRKEINTKLITINIKPVSKIYANLMRSFSRAASSTAQQLKKQILFMLI
jgi:hypothetical protein